MFPKLDVNKPLFVDTETCGFYGKVRLLQLRQVGGGVYLIHWPDPLETLVYLNDYHCIFHNAHYDISTLQKQSKTTMTLANYDDTFLLARLALPHLLDFSLDAVMHEALGYDPYTEANLDKKKLQKSKWDVEELSEDQLTYASIDVEYLPDVWELVKGALDEFNYKLDKITLDYCLQFQWDGMPLDEYRLGLLWKEQQAIVNKNDMPINVNSYQQVRAYLDCKESNDLALATMALKGDKRAAKVRETRKALKLISFLKKYEKTAVFGRIYGLFKPSARSGRLTSNDHNLQQTPRAAKCVIGYPEDAGRVLIYGDYPQLELRTIAAIAGCVSMADIFKKFGDVHNITAEFIYGPEYTKEQRVSAKTYNFNLLYGGGVGMLVSILIANAGMLIGKDQASKDKRKWLRLWPELAKWQTKGIKDFNKKRLGSTPLGRQYSAKLMTDQLNIENQGAGAEVAKLALHYFMQKKPAYVDVINFIHDSYILDCPDDPDLYKPAAALLAECMQEAWYEMSGLFKIQDIPMPIEIGVGYNWGDIEEGKTIYNYSTLNVR